MADEFHQPADDQGRDATARMALIERSILMLLFVGLFIGVLTIVKPFTTAILFGAALAIAAWPLRQALVRYGLGHGTAAALLLLLSLVLVVLPMLVVAPNLADQLSQGTRRVQSYFAATPEQPAISGLPLIGRRLGTVWNRVVEVKGSLRALAGALQRGRWKSKTGAANLRSLSSHHPRYPACRDSASFCSLPQLWYLSIWVPMRSITRVRRARPLHPALYRAREEGQPEAPSSARFRAMPGEAPQSGRASAPSGVQYDGVRPAVLASVIRV
jgi:hypothetical protein